MPATIQAGFYLLVGPDRPRKLQRVQDLERALNVQPLDRHHFDAQTMTAAQLIALCRQQPALSPVRLVVIDQAHRLDKSAVEGLLAHAVAITATACVVLLVETELTARHALSHVGEPFRIERFSARPVPTANPFHLAEALGTRQLGHALSSLQEQRLAGKEPFELLGLIAWQINRWMLVKRLARAGMATSRIAAMTGLQIWQVERLQREVAQRTLTSLQELLRRCWELTRDAKSGRAIPDVAVEQLVIELCVAPAFA